nr:PEP-CTERM sorting domain-containing protein [uncultured Roseateles sp.]
MHLPVATFRGAAPQAVFKLKPVAPIALAAALALWALPGQAGISTTGSVTSNPAAALGPGDTVAPGTAFGIGAGSAGSLLVDGGSFLQAARLSFGNGGSGNGSGLLSGTGSRIELVGNGTGSQTQRLLVGDWGTGVLTVAAGATLDTSTQNNACLIQFHYCDSFVGGAAGDNATLNVTGAGSQVRIGNQLFVGHPGLGIQNLVGYTYGTPGATVTANVNVLAGAELKTDRAQIGTRQWDSSSTGFERSVSNVLISGTGSRWVVVGGQAWDAVTGAIITPDAGISTANDRYAVANIDIRDGGLMRFEGPANAYNYLNLSSGGRTDMTVRGAGSMMAFIGDNGVLQVGRALGSASLSVLSGAEVNGAWYTSVGRDASFGELLIDGSGSLLSMTGLSTTAVAGAQQNAIMDIGRNGTGVVNVRNGGQIVFNATEARTNGPQLSLGRDAASSGTLNIDGAGSVVSLKAASVLAGGGPGEAFNPLVRIGREGSGQLSITNGGKLLMEGQAVSTVANSRSTTLLVGGISDVLNGGRGIALVSGAGSQIALSGSDAYIGVGHGPQSNGQLTVQNQGMVSATNMNVGRSGGVGVLKLDAATLNLSGQQTGNNLSGAGLSVGVGGGIGVATIGNGSVVNISNMGSAGASLNLGGSGVYPLGDGSLTLSGGSAIHITAAPGLAAMSVGRDGTAFARVRGGSSIDLGDGSLYVGRLTGSDGTLIISENSSITAGWVGVGRRKITGGDTDGGSATMVINNSVLTAPTIVIGTNGFLGGNGTINGTVTNYGIFSPGNSPGTMVINGAYSAAAGSRLIMEVESDGMGGFKTDQVVFGEGSLLDLSALKVEFRFLGNTDPNAFKSSGGFDVDTFFRSRGAGGDSDLAHTLFATASFTAQADHYAISNFTFSADGGAAFSAVPVPEPGAWALMFSGLLLTASAARRRRR